MPPPLDQEGSARDLPRGTGRQARTHQHLQSRHGQEIDRLEQTPMQRPPDCGPIASTRWPTRGPLPRLGQTGDISGPPKAPPPLLDHTWAATQADLASTSAPYAPNATWCRRQGILTHCPHPLPHQRHTHGGESHLPSPLSLLPPPLGTRTRAPQLPALLPVFGDGADAGNQQTPLSLLADVAASARDATSNHGTADNLMGHSHSGLHAMGPFNPIALLPAKVSKKILDLEFVEMNEISSDDPPSAIPGHPPPPPRKPIQDISRWVEKFSIMAAVLTTRYPEKAPELLAYQASIVRAERNFDDNRWVSYDRCYRREALANKSLDWSLPNSRLYNEAFTGHAHTLPRCSHCLQEDHIASACPRNPMRAWFPWIPLEPPQTTTQPAQQKTQSQERCNRYNEGRCRNTANTCKYTHRCRECWGSHPSYHCPRSGRSHPRSRSPQRPGNNPGPPPTNRR